MRRRPRVQTLLPVYLTVLSLLLISALICSEAVTVLSESAPINARTCVIIDAGHGGVDGGATSCTGKLESSFNLEIALRLNDLMHLLGLETKMIRTEDISVYTEGNTIAAKKMSDLKERVRICNAEDRAILVSIHQNNFDDSRYNGAQVFYSATPGSADLANKLQATLIRTLNPGSRRATKQASSIYLMEHINCTGILIECGFLSNPEEEARLRSEEYQKKLCCVITAAVSTFQSNT